MLLFRWFSSLLTHLVLVIPTIASLVNRTIDDEFGDSVTGAVPTYAPQGWLQGQNCTGCSFNSRNVDITQVFNGSWHSAMHIPGNTNFNITASFSGIAVYVFNLIALQAPTNLTFYLDGEVADTFFHPIQPDGAMGVQYRVPVFSKTGLSNGPHTLEIVSGGTTHSLTLFDYIEYTVDDEAGPVPASTSLIASGPATPTRSMPASPSTQDSHTPVAAILGGAVGGGAAITSVLVAIYIIRRRRHIKPHPPGNSSEKLSFYEDNGEEGADETERGKPARRSKRLSSFHLSRLSDTSTLPYGGELHLVVSRAMRYRLTLASAGSVHEGSGSAGLSTAASLTLRTASRSERTMELLQRIHVLEAQVQVLELLEKGVPSSRSENSSPEKNPFDDRDELVTQMGDVTVGDERVERGAEEDKGTLVKGNPSVVAQLASLRHEIATLRGEMERIQRLEDQLPLYSM